MHKHLLKKRFFQKKFFESNFHKKIKSYLFFSDFEIILDIIVSNANNLIDIIKKMNL